MGTLSDPDKNTWALAMADVKPLKGKRRLPPPPPDVETLKRKPIKHKSLMLRPASHKLYDGKIDLHGLTETGAYQTLMLFMKSEIARGSKKLLVITGKGTGGSSILRTQVPRWLDIEPFASAIRMIESAPQNLGGEGAYLVTMKAPKKK